MSVLAVSQPGPTSVNMAQERTKRLIPATEVRDNLANKVFLAVMGVLKSEFVENSTKEVVTDKRLVYRRDFIEVETGKEIRIAIRCEHLMSSPVFSLFESKFNEIKKDPEKMACYQYFFKKEMARFANNYRFDLCEIENIQSLEDSKIIKFGVVSVIEQICNSAYKIMLKDKKLWS